MNCAEKCRLNGWIPGTILVGDEGSGPTEIIITAVGESNILARRISHNGEPRPANESSWTLQFRDWKKVGIAESTSDKEQCPPHEPLEDDSGAQPLGVGAVTRDGYRRRVYLCKYCGCLFVNHNEKSLLFTPIRWDGDGKG